MHIPLDRQTHTRNIDHFVPSITKMTNISPLIDEGMYSGLKLTSTTIEKEQSSECVPRSDSAEHSLCSSQDFELEEAESSLSFATLQLNYLLITLVVMLADGLQGKKRKRPQMSPLYTGISSPWTSY